MICLPQNIQYQIESFFAIGKQSYTCIPYFYSQKLLLLFKVYIIKMCFITKKSKKLFNGLLLTDNQHSDFHG